MNACLKQNQGRMKKMNDFKEMCKYYPEKLKEDVKIAHDKLFTLMDDDKTIPNDIWPIALFHHFAFGVDRSKCSFNEFLEATNHIAKMYKPLWDEENE